MLDTYRLAGMIVISSREQRKEPEMTKRTNLLTPEQASKLFTDAKAEAAETCRVPRCVHESEALHIVRNRLGISTLESKHTAQGRASIRMSRKAQVASR